MTIAQAGRNLAPARWILRNHGELRQVGLNRTEVDPSPLTRSGQGYFLATSIYVVALFLCLLLLTAEVKSPPVNFR